MRLIHIVTILAAWLFSVTANAQQKYPLLKKQVSFGGEKRSYSLYIPQSIDLNTSKKVPIVLVLHGGGGNGKVAAETTGFSAKAESEGFIALYPDGSGRRLFNLNTWNVTHCCGYSMRKKKDDIGYISYLIDLIIEKYPIDSNRIYVTGMSNGGMMSHVIGLRLADKVAAIAPVMAGLFGDEVTPEIAMPTLIINGLQDKTFPMQGGLPAGPFAKSWDGTHLQQVKYQGVFWAKNNHCSLVVPEAQLTPLISVWDYKCPAGAPVIHYVVNDNGHAWPGGKKGSHRGDKPSTAMNATDVIWEFFSQQSLK